MCGEPLCFQQDDALDLASSDSDALDEIEGLCLYHGFPEPNRHQMLAALQMLWRTKVSIPSHLSASEMEESASVLSPNTAAPFQFLFAAESR